MSDRDERLFSLLIYIAIGVVAYVIVIGGIVCVRDQGYVFQEYLRDLTHVTPYLFGAVVAVLLRPLVRGRGGGEG